MAPRSRTGCLTCRQRKLKCDEQRPVCGQCTKAKRECFPSSGITFRHQQNPSMNGASIGSGGLENFYGYKETFRRGTTWVGIPKNLTFVHTSNPYEDEEDESNVVRGYGVAEGDNTIFTGSDERLDDNSDYTGLAQAAQAAYPAYATHGLEALSAVATQDQYSYAPPPATMNQHNIHGSPSLPRDTTPPPQDGQTPPSPNLDFILHSGASVSAIISSSPTVGNIDPRLHGEMAQVRQGSNAEDVRLRSCTTPPLSYGSGEPPSLHSREGHRPCTLHRHSGNETHQSRRRAAIEDPELVFLLKSYSEGVGEWMDVFDLNRYFSTVVPVEALNSTLLLDCCAALAAKTMARVGDRSKRMLDNLSTEYISQTGVWLGAPTTVEDRLQRAQAYFDTAVASMRRSSSPTSSPYRAPTNDKLLEEPAEASWISADNVQELSTAIALLCAFDHIDEPNEESTNRSSGVNNLLGLFNDRLLPRLLLPAPQPASQHEAQQVEDEIGNHELSRDGHMNRNCRSAFWEIARLDVFSAFVHNSSTHLNTGDLNMWRLAGLKLTAEGYICPSNPLCAGFTVEHAMEDDMISNALCWIVMKLVNFISAGDIVPENLSPIGLGVRQGDLLTYWEGLNEQLKVWHSGLPESFLPTGVCPSFQDRRIEQKWYARPLCASTLQMYHFAVVQLLYNKPHLSTGSPAVPRIPRSLNLAARHASYAGIMQQSRMHAKEIVAISLGHSDRPTQVHSIQALWTAGLVLGVDSNHRGREEDPMLQSETSVWRDLIVSELQRIESDTGWACQYRVDNLRTVWQSLDADEDVDAYT